MGIYAAVLHALNNMDKDLLLIADFTPNIAYKLISNRNGIVGVKETIPHYMVMFI